jgi:hypothetical protein
MRGITALAVLALCLSSCSIVRTQFIDVDGTSFEQTLLLAPFSSLDAQDAAMMYQWTPESGEISVGSQTSGLDQTPQIEAMRAAVGAALAAYAAYIAIPAPASP